VPATAHDHAKYVSARTYAVVAIFVELSPAAAVGAVGVPVNPGLASGARDVSVGCTWSALANVFDVPTAPVPSIFGVVEEACPNTKAVVATCVVFVFAAAVGAVGVPVSAGDAAGAIDESTYADVIVVHVGPPVSTAVTAWFVQVPVPAPLLLTFDPGMSRNICTVVLPALACSTRPRICVPVGRVAPASWHKG
jgi:hypothetical protein